MVQSENNRMAQALQHHLSESEQLHKASTGLSEGHKRLINKKALHDVIIKEKVQQMKTQAEKVIAGNLYLPLRDFSLRTTTGSSAEADAEVWLEDQVASKQNRGNGVHTQSHSPGVRVRAGDDR